MASARRPSIVVLLIDDQLIIAQSIRELLASESHIALHYCQDATSALQQAAELQPTVILQDLLMPGVDGLEVLQQIKRSEATREVPVIVLSSKEDPETKAAAFRLGANDYLIKLPSAVELIARIRYHSEAFRNGMLRRTAMQALTESREELRRSHEQIARQAVVLEARNRFITKTFGRYLSDEVVNQLLDSPEGLRLGGENRVVTVMLSDLRGFTAVSDQMSATDVVRMLNTFLGAMSQVISSHQGTIDKFMGDAVMAIFGAPISRNDDALRAARCAIEMHHALAEVNRMNSAAGLPALQMGIALHTGEVVVGNIGSDLRSEYSVIGSNVNLTARIESLSVGGQVLVSDQTREAIGLPAITGRELRFRAKGFEREMIAWELFLTNQHCSGRGGVSALPDSSGTAGKSAGPSGASCRRSSVLCPGRDCLYPGVSGKRPGTGGSMEITVSDDGGGIHVRLPHQSAQWWWVRGLAFPRWMRPARARGARPADECRQPAPPSAGPCG